MKQLSFLLFATLLFLVFSCSKQDKITPALLPDNAVNLSNLQAGQKSFYQRYTTKCDSLESEFTFTRDTLVLEVAEGDGHWIFKEYYTEYSPRYLNGDYITTVEYKVIEDNDMLLLPQREESALFFFYANDTIQLRPDQRADLLQQDCQLLISDNPFKGNDIGHVDNFNIGPISQKDKTVVSCVPFFDLDAYLFYDEYQLTMSHAIYITYFWDEIIGTSIEGWVLIEE